MKKLTKRTADINARFQLASAERAMYEIGSEYYIQLSEVIRMILSEFKYKFSDRYSFRLRGDAYTLVVLDPGEAF